MPDRLKERSQTKIRLLVHQVGGWACGQQPHPAKTHSSTETDTTGNSISQDAGGGGGHQTTDHLNNEDQTSDGVPTPTANPLAPKMITRIGCWNLRTLFQTGTLVQAIGEMHKNGLHLLDVKDGRRKRGRPKETWRRSIEKELKAHHLTWNEVIRLAADRQHMCHLGTKRTERY